MLLPLALAVLASQASAAPLAPAAPSQATRQAEAFPRQAAALREALERLDAAPTPMPRFVHRNEGRDGSFVLRSEAGAVTIEASGPAGAAHAAATLLALAEVEDGMIRWPEFAREDAPAFPYRAFMVDMGRNPHSPETLRSVVELLWLTKVNLLHLHLSDDQLFSWPSRAFPRLTSERAGWTLEDFVALEAYASARGVSIVPELDVPGHSTILRREYPEVFGETPTELATRPEAQAGVETLLAEMLEVFESARFVHVGGDEAYGVPEEAQRDFINRLNEFVRSQGRRTVVWEGPSLGEGDNKVSTDVLHVNWRTIAFPAQAMLDAGYEVVNASWDPHYVVDHYPRTMFTAVDLERCFAWDPTRFGHVDPGMPTFTEPHRTRSAEGIQGFTLAWWEGREENLLPLCAARLAVIGEAAWRGARTERFEEARPRLEALLSRFEQVAGLELPDLPTAVASTQAGNLAFGAEVRASRGGAQPHFGPRRLTNGLTDRFDHFLGFPTDPEPLEIVVTLPQPGRADRVVVHETAVGQSFEHYEVFVSADGESYTRVGATEQGSRGESDQVVHAFPAQAVHSVRILTRGCENLTFPSFSRLTEVRVLAAD